MDYAVIMAGGSGTRLWPLSRQGMPKQLLTLVGGRSLLQLAFERALTLVSPDRVVVCAGQVYAGLIASQLPGLPPENLLAEPVGRDSLAAICWSVATIARRDADAVVAILTADHLISPQAAFTATLRRALTAAATVPGALVTCGVIPTSPHTGYGYVHVGEPVTPGVFAVRRFAEKPAADVARRYLAEGDWWWNSGMFCWRAETFLTEVARLQPGLAAGVERLLDNPDQIADIYPALTKISVDYAVMEPVSATPGPAHVLTVGLDADWSDIGGYAALAALLPQVDGNAAEGTVVTWDAADNLLINRTDGHLLAVAGCTNLIVVEDGDVTLVCPLDQAEAVKPLVEAVRQRAARYA
ncbi:MAG: mannose-1-phosphate guanylyltransferase [Propionibacteriaceae bacterium]|jgi:mannose-1-phosphate guanylyltransferase|nr:mannose-1-phosphate guanylyltransferase [Propionibacteriaceae bacterium]